jgi:ribosomal protein S18 acetylase RimI-like enzyme
MASVRSQGDPATTAAQAEPCERLSWDSDFFGVGTARVRGETLTANLVREIDAWCRQRQISLLYFQSRADDAEAVRRAEDAGFRLVDVRLTFERDLKVEPAKAIDSGVGEFVESDLPALLEIARSSFTDSRFYYDGRIPRGKCDELFEVWTTSSCRGRADRVLVAREAGRAAGFVTCRADRDSSSGRIDLIGVAESARGKGVGRALVQSALAWAGRESLGKMIVVTQGRNIAAQRLYQRCGFVTRSLHLYYHKWYD